MAECELPVNRALDVKRIRLPELPVVPVSRPVDQQDLVTFVHCQAVSINRAGECPGQRLDRRIEAEAFLDRGGQEGRVVNYGLPLIGILIEEDGAVADKVGRRLVPGDKQENAHPKELVLVEMFPIDLRRDKGGQQVVAW